METAKCLVDSLFGGFLKVFPVAGTRVYQGFWAKCLVDVGLTGAWLVWFDSCHQVDGDQQDLGQCLGFLVDQPVSQGVRFRTKHLLITKI